MLPHLSGWFAGPLAGIHAEGRIAEWVFGPAVLKDIHDQRDKLVQELRKAALHPIELVGTAAKSTAQEYTSKWKRFQQVMGQASLAGNFEAGRILGGVLVDILILISTVGDIAKTAKFLSEIPELVRLSRGLKAVGKATGGLIKDETGAVRLGGVPPEAPTGLAYRIDLDKHLPRPDGFVEDAAKTGYGRLRGTHNIENAKVALDAKNAHYSLEKTSTPGIYELRY